MSENLKNNRLGEEGYNIFGSLMRIVSYRNTRDIDVYFPEYDWTFYNSRYVQFKKGSIRCPYEPRVYGVGYIGEGCYKSKENNEITKPYNIWTNMLRRCYETCSTINLTYEDCYVCDEWLNYQNFAEWYYNNYYECNGERMHVDKDILYKGNRIYSPDTCIFVPMRINSLFTKCDKSRGDLPIGVYKQNNKFVASCDNGTNTIYLGRFNTALEAFNKYKEFKENVIKNVADEYKDSIPIELYNALYNYQIDIND